MLFGETPHLSDVYLEYVMRQINDKSIGASPLTSRTHSKLSSLHPHNIFLLHTPHRHQSIKDMSRRQSHPHLLVSFRALQAEVGLTIFGKAAYDLPAHASLIGTGTEATAAAMSLYVNKSYTSVVNDFFTDAGYEAELREHELVFVRMGEDGQ